MCRWGGESMTERFGDHLLHREQLLLPGGWRVQSGLSEPKEGGLRLLLSVRECEQACSMREERTFVLLEPLRAGRRQ